MKDAKSAVVNIENALTDIYWTLYVFSICAQLYAERELLKAIK